MQDRQLSSTTGVLHPSAFTRLPAEDTVVTVLRGGSVDGAVAALDDLYREVLPGARSDANTADGVTLVVTGAPVPAGPLVWGTPWSAAGPATDDELRRVLARPSEAAALTGRFVLVGRVGSAVRLVTSADVVHCLERADHDRSSAWSTRGMAALAAVGRAIELDAEAVAEVVLLDFVLGDRSIVRGVHTVEEATSTDVDAAGATTTSWWSREERLAPGGATTAEQLRSALTAAVVPVAAAEGAHLGLTAGRDSLLVASCLAEAGASIATFTMGDPSWPDAVGARAVADRLGWQHHAVLPDAALEPSFDLARRLSAWSEGQLLARDMVGAPMRWPSGLRVGLSGSGGEIGRAFWREPSALVPAGAPPAVLERIAAEQATFPGDGRRQLDALYAFGRMRKWLGRGRPNPGQWGTTAAYLGPEVVRCLLDLPADGFDEALALGPDLRSVAAAAIGDARARRSLPQRVRTRLRPPVHHELRHLEQMLSVAGAALYPVRDALGSVWWEHARTSAPTSTRSRLSLWNAVSVAAFLAWNDDRKNAFQSV